MGWASSPLVRRLVGFYRRNFDWYVASLSRELRGCRSVLDLGCGEDSPLRYLSVPSSLGVDSFEPYLQASQRRGIHSEYLRADVRMVSFPRHSFDVVLALDVLEHLSREEGLGLLQQMEVWAARKVIILTPNGHLPQQPYDMNPGQAHRSGWSVADCHSLGYRVRGVRGWRPLRGERAEVRLRPRLLGSFLSGLTQPLVYWRPRLAFQLFCVKRIAAVDDEGPERMESR